MTTAADVKWAMRPLLDRHDDLVVMGRMLVILPVRHVVRFICIDRELDPDGFEVRTAMNLTFLNLVGGWPLSGGWPLRIPKRRWLKSDPESIELLRNIIEHEALPALRAIKTIDDFVTSRSNNRESSDEFLANSYLLARIAIVNGDLERAIPLIEPLLPRHVPAFFPALLARDRTALAHYFREQQRRTIEAMKLTKYFVPEPFPLEFVSK
jgi:hypothetical protein